MGTYLLAQTAIGAAAVLAYMVVCMCVDMWSWVVAVAPVVLAQPGIPHVVHNVEGGGGFVAWLNYAPGPTK